MYHQPKSTSRKKTHRLSTRPKKLHIHAGPFSFAPEEFDGWLRVLHLGFDGYRAYRFHQDLILIGSIDQTWSRA